MYDGKIKVPRTAEFTFEKPFYYDDMTYDEYYVEWCYYMLWSALRENPYKSLRKQLEDGDISSISNEYKVLCPYPENCTAFADLVSHRKKFPFQKPLDFTKEKKSGAV